MGCIIIDKIIRGMKNVNHKNWRDVPLCTTLTSIADNEINFQSDRKST